jgi:hypothetical protein
MKAVMIPKFRVAHTHISCNPPDLKFVKNKSLRSKGQQITFPNYAIHSQVRGILSQAAGSSHSKLFILMLLLSEGRASETSELCDNMMLFSTSLSYTYRFFRLQGASSFLFFGVGSV